MKHTTVAALLLAPLVTSCQTTTADPNYLAQLNSYQLTITAQREVEVAKARAEEARYQAMAAIAERSDAQTKSMAILALALGGRADVVSAHRSGDVMLPRIPETQEDRALKWASVFAGPTTALISSYFGYQLGKTQSNNQAQTTQASYAALVAFKPTPQPFVPTTSTTTTNNITTSTDAWITNRDGLVVVGGAQPTSGQQDNSPIAVIPPVVVVPVSTAPTFGPGPTFGP